MTQPQQIDPNDHKLSLQFERVKGMDADERSFLIGEKWRQLVNVRTLLGVNQVAPRKTSFTMSATMLAIENIPVGDNEYGVWIGLSAAALWQIKPTANVNLGDLTTSGDRWSTCAFNDRVFFTNPANRVRYTDGAQLRELFGGRQCWAMASGLLLTGDGPFTARDAQDSGEDGTLPVFGDLGTSFTWTTGTYYRVYYNANEFFFPVGSSIQYYLRTTSSQDYTLTGTVIEANVGYVVVLATNTVAAVPNTSDGPSVRGRVSITAMDIPLGRYVGMLYDHVIVGCPTYKGAVLDDVVMWSHLNDWAEWTPRIGSEADKYTCSDYQRGDDMIRGVTGMQPFKMQLISGIHETMLVFTNSCVYSVMYTGLPRVVRVSPIIRDHGNGLRYATACLDNAVVWYDTNHRDFFIYRGQGPEPIGQGIRTYFDADLNTDSDLRQKTYSYVDRFNFEVVWVYVSIASNSAYDKAVSFNYRTNTWSIRTVSDVTAFGRLSRRAKTSDELVGTNSAQTGIANNLERTADQRSLVWGDTASRLLVEAGNGDTLIATSLVTLETGDLLYGSAQKIKEVYSFTINATGGTGFSGVLVEVSARESVDSAVAWTSVGTWTPTLPAKMLTFQPIAGKVLRYRFTPQGSPLVGFVWSGFEDAVRLSNANR